MRQPFFSVCAFTNLAKVVMRLARGAGRRLARLRRKLPRDLLQALRSVNLRLRMKHCSGPRKVTYSKTELIVLCVVRNGELYLKSFLEHYRSLGVKHFVFLDNASTDRTAELLTGHDDITVLESSCPYSKYETLMKEYLVRRFSRNRWNLFVDCDELFDYPFSKSMSLDRLLGYLNANGYTAVVAQMLDMFSDVSFAKLNCTPEDSLKERYPYYDISNIVKRIYSYGYNARQTIHMHRHGIRRTIFGTTNDLSKAALTFVDGEIELFVNCHHFRYASMADFTCLLLHYPFISSFREKVIEAAETGRYKMSADGEYQLYAKTLKDNPDLSLRLDTARVFHDVESLLDQDFLVASDSYRTISGRITTAKASDNVR